MAIFDTHQSRLRQTVAKDSNNPQEAAGETEVPCADTGRFCWKEYRLINAEKS